MLTSFFLPLLSSFVVGPFMTDLNGRLAAAGAPRAVIEQVQTCATSAPMALAERAAADPWWGISTVIGVATGVTDPREMLAATSPACAASVAAWTALPRG